MKWLRGYHSTDIYVALAHASREVLVEFWISRGEDVWIFWIHFRSITLSSRTPVDSFWSSLAVFGVWCSFAKARGPCTWARPRRVALLRGAKSYPQSKKRLETPGVGLRNCQILALHAHRWNVSLTGGASRSQAGPRKGGTWKGEQIEMTRCELHIFSQRGLFSRPVSACGGFKTRAFFGRG